SFFKSENSNVRISYKIYKDLPYIDICCDVFWGEKEKTLKLKIPTALKGSCVAQSVYGKDYITADGSEQVAHRYIAMTENGESLSVFNNCCYGVSAENKDMYITLLRGVAYCAHPILDRPLIDKGRYIPFVEQGKTRFTFRIAVCKAFENEARAIEFCEPPYALNAYPNGKGQKLSSLKIDCREVIISALFIENGKPVARLYNSADKELNCTLSYGTKVLKLSFFFFFIKTVNL
ncbi:MAG: hypothetical protein MJ212_06530, partial [Alphaproteobacteria bacterium]|nr:hypothetical protein [Alphaproteobacteria bacterium]